MKSLRIKNQILLFLAGILLLAAVDGFSSLIQPEDEISNQTELLEGFRDDEGGNRYRNPSGPDLDFFLPAYFTDFSVTLQYLTPAGTAFSNQGYASDSKLFLLYSSLIFYS